MTNTEFANNILEDINYDITKLNRAYICEDAALTTTAEINEMFGSFADFRAFCVKGMRDGTLPGGAGVATPAVTGEAPAEQPTPVAATTPTDPATDGLAGVGVEGTPAATETAPEKKEVYVTDHSGTTRKVTCPANTHIKTILAALKIRTEEGYEIRVNGVLEDDVYAIPADKAHISVMRQVKGN